ncbi:MAG: biopolymer transporter ExbD [Planctomycetaceae bacterium]|nr:biopolymer transporter ExbD [Planctomycetaceae bacterium]
MNRKRVVPELKMTAMIDIIFLLLIFFVCTANFRLHESQMKADMSLDGNSDNSITLVIPDTADIDVAVIKIAFRESPSWQIASNKCNSIAQLRALLRQLGNVQNDLPIIIDSEPNVPIEHVIDTYDACRVAGLTNIQFAARRL